MATLLAPATTAFDNITPASGVITHLAADAMAIGFTLDGSKTPGLLKLQVSTTATTFKATQASWYLGDAAPVLLTLPAGSDPLPLTQSSTVWRVDLTLSALLIYDDWITLGNLDDRINAGWGNDFVDAGAGNDLIQGSSGLDQLFGGSGIDTAVFEGNRASYGFSSNSTSFTVSDGVGTDGVDTLTGIERLQFADKRLAIDLDGHAGQVAKLLGAVFGPKAVALTDYVGIGLTLLDQGMGYSELAALAVAVAGKSTPADVVALLWTNLFGSAPSTAEAQPYVDMLAGGFPVGELTTLAADTAWNIENIDLAGLAKSGLEFVV